MNALLAWSLSQGANALNVLAGIIVAHLASPYEFSRFATLSAAIAIMSAVLNPMINELAQRVARHRVIETKALRSRTIVTAFTCCLIAICACTSIVTTTYEAVIVYALIPCFLVGQSWATGMFYGLHRMIAFGAVQCIAGVLRVATLLALLYLGLTFSGFAVSYLVFFLVTIAASRYLFVEHKTSDCVETWHTNWRLICGFFLLALPFSIDQPLVQAFLPGVSADYAALMTYTRSVMLLASPALTLVFSASLQPSTSKPLLKATTLRSPLLIASTLAGALAFTLWIAHPLLFPLLLGAQYSHVSPHLGLALLGMVLYVISYFLVQRMLLSCRWWLCAALIVPPLVQGWLIASRATPHLSSLITISLITFSIQALIALVASYFHRRGIAQA